MRSKIPAPPPSMPRFQRGTPRAGNPLNRTRWTHVGFGLCVARLDQVSRAYGLGARASPPPRTAALGRDYRDGDGLRPACGFEAAPPAVRRPCGQGAAYWAAAERLAPLCHCALLRCRAAPNSATWTAPSGCAPAACLNSRPAQTAYGRQRGARWPLATCGLVAKPCMPPPLCLCRRSSCELASILPLRLKPWRALRALLHPVPIGLRPW